MNEFFHGLADGSQLQYALTRVERPAVTVVFLNGSFFNHHQWDLLVSRLDRKAKSIGMATNMLLLDYRGFSNAKPLQEALPFSALMDDVLEILDHEQISGEIRLVGASLGSIVGLGLLRAYPERFSTLVAYGLVAPTKQIVQHVVEIFKAVQKSLILQHFLPAPDDSRIDARSVVPIARTLWDVFVMEYSRTHDSIKAKGFTDAYASYILKYMAGTSLKTIEKFLEFCTDESIMMQAIDFPLPPGMFTRITAFQGEDDLVTPFPAVNGFASSSLGLRLIPVKKKGHTDYMLDGAICDAMVNALLGII